MVRQANCMTAGGPRTEALWCPLGMQPALFPEKSTCRPQSTRLLWYDRRIARQQGTREPEFCGVPSACNQLPGGCGGGIRPGRVMSMLMLAVFLLTKWSQTNTLPPSRLKAKRGGGLLFVPFSLFQTSDSIAIIHRVEFTSLARALVYFAGYSYVRKV